MKKSRPSNTKAIKQKNNKCNRYGKILYNYKNRANKDGYIIHLTLHFWNKELIKHPDILGRFDDALDTIENGIITYSMENQTIMYIRYFPRKPSLEVLACRFSCQKYCIIHVMNLIGEIISLEKRRK